MNKNKFLLTPFLIFLLFSIVKSGSAQVDNEYNRIKYNPENPPNLFQNRLVTGGNVGLLLGTVTMIDISPFIGYKLTDKLTPGIGFTYQYYNDGTFAPPVTLNVWGGRIFLRYNVWKRLFAHVEYEYLTFKTAIYSPIDAPQQISLNNILVGGGYSERIGENVYANITVLWNINESAYSLDSNPIIRLGFTFGL